MEQMKRFLLGIFWITALLAGLSSCEVGLDDTDAPDSILTAPTVDYYNGYDNAFATLTGVSAAGDWLMAVDVLPGKVYRVNNSEILSEEGTPNVGQRYLLSFLPSGEETDGAIPVTVSTATWIETLSVELRQEGVTYGEDDLYLTTAVFSSDYLTLQAFYMGSATATHDLRLVVDGSARPDGDGMLELTLYHDAHGDSSGNAYFTRLVSFSLKEAPGYQTDEVKGVRIRLSNSDRQGANEFTLNRI